MNTIRRLGLMVLLFTPTMASAENPELTIVTENIPPFNYVKDGNIQGLSVDILNAILKDLNIEAKIRVYPWTRAYQYALNNKNVLIFTIAKTPERRALFKWVGNIVESKQFLYVRPYRKDIVINNLEDVKNYRVGVVRKTLRSEFLKGKGFEPNVNLFFVNSYEQNLKMLLRDRIDIWAVNEYTYYFTLKQLNVKKHQLKTALKLDLTSDMQMAFNRDTSDELVDKFRTSLESFKASPSYQEILSSYAHPPS